MDPCHVSDMQHFMNRLLLSALLLFSACASAQDAAPTPAPAFTLPLLTKDGSASLQDYRGKVIYLDFWASWCGPCRVSLPLLDKLRAELGPRGFEVLAINLDEDARDGRAFLDEIPVSYPTLFDNAGTAAAYELRGMPTAYLIDRKGNIRHIHMGFKAKDIDAVRDTVLELLYE